jgi:AcrR family transcriptional regulator
MSPVAAEPNGAPPRRPRGRPGHDRDSVLRRAIDLFNQRGYDATSIGDLAQDLGVTKSAIYHHVDSKETLLSLALDEALDGLSAAVAGALEADDSAYERLRSTVEASVRILATHLPAVTLLLRVRGNGPVEQAALARRRLIDEQLATLVKDAVAEGSLRSDTDPELISRLVFGMVNSLVDWFHPGGAISADELATTVTSVLFDGLVVRR